VEAWGEAEGNGPTSGHFEPQQVATNSLVTATVVVEHERSPA